MRDAFIDMMVEGGELGMKPRSVGGRICASVPVLENDFSILSWRYFVSSRIQIVLWRRWGAIAKKLEDLGLPLSSWGGWGCGTKGEG